MLATHWAEQQRCRSTTSAESAVVWEISTLMRYRSGLPPQASLASDVAGSRFEVLDDDHAAASMGARVRELPRIGGRSFARPPMGPGPRVYARLPSFRCDWCWRTGRSGGCGGNPWGGRG